MRDFLPPGWGVQGQRGIVFVITGPSGAGKSSVISEVLRRDPSLAFSVSATTRPPRPGEVHGQDYYFIDEEKFDRMLKQGELLEWTVYQGHKYGTPRSELERPLGQGHDVLVNVEVRGALAIQRASLGYPVVLIFLVPPSWAELVRRIQARGTESPEVLEKRLEIAKEEIRFIPQFHYLVVNDELERAVQQLEAIIVAERARLVKVNAP